MKSKFYGRLIAVLGLSLMAGGALAQTEAFPQCIQRLQGEARERGFPDHLVAVLGEVKPQERTITYDRNQPEFVQTFAGYYNKRVNDFRIDKGRKLLSENREFLAELTRRYGVPGQYLVSFWGMESNFGNFIGKIPILDTLATLACDNRRSTFFTGELFSALELMQTYEFEVGDMEGSWAGAIGQTQFIPSVYVRYGIDGDGDGKVDLWRSEKDALASAANFLQQLGWTPELRWGREVHLPDDFPYHHAGINNVRPLSEWKQLGVAKADGSPLPNADVKAVLLVPIGADGPKFLAYDNFHVIMKWNRSQFYALSVGVLADRINGAGGLRQPLPDTPPLTRDQIVQIQTQLKARGFDAGEADGQLGPQTNSAIRDFQKSQNLQADGFADMELFQSLN
ncbi:lytic murein transglycosylase [Aestuariicella hydrocarbonica]|uniref:Lytic murein transglycosylase n=1 Tax=Pseudomaricurvus hydrocarbonicus TaxID=1470433 RepID=A0A9E5MNC6_9GAMM|nr:lytic murein transglycosylase [Aestuariicella hydrocarbonica]NHO67405.1 lytic murein transglycosylase [Aestuariicella hydrocarbonica]